MKFFDFFSKMISARNKWLAKNNIPNSAVALNTK